MVATAAPFKVACGQAVRHVLGTASMPSSGRSPPPRRRSWRKPSGWRRARPAERSASGRS
jgi:hypothetical protein